MTTTERLVVAIQEAKTALEHRARAAGIAEPEAFAAEFVDALRAQGWRPFAPPRTLPAPPLRWVDPPSDLIRQTRAHLRANRPSEGETDG